MTTTRSYLATDALTADVLLLSATPTDAGPWIVELDETLFHVKGGGQPSDAGQIGRASVLAVERTPHGAILHTITGDPGSSPGERVTIAVDAATRARHSRLHTAGHLLAAVAERELPWLRAVGAHHYPGEARVDLELHGAGGDAPTPEHLERPLRVAVRGALPVSVSDPFGYRLVQIGDFAPIGCGGTHVHSTAELGEVTIRSVRLKGKTVRIGYDVANL